MKTPLNWLRTHLRIWLGIETLAHRHSALKLEMYEPLMRAQNSIEQLHREQMALRGGIVMLKRESEAKLEFIQKRQNELNGEIEYLKSQDEKLLLDEPRETRPFTGWAEGDAIKPGDKLTFAPKYTVPVITWDEDRVDVRTEPLDTTFPFQSQHCEK